MENLIAWIIAHPFWCAALWLVSGIASAWLIEEWLDAEDFLDHAELTSVGRIICLTLIIALGQALWFIWLCVACSRRLTKEPEDSPPPRLPRSIFLVLPGGAPSDPPPDPRHRWPPKPGPPGA